MYTLTKPKQWLSGAPKTEAIQFAFMINENDLSAAFGPLAVSV